MSLAVETDERMGGKSRLKAGCSQDWPPHKAGYQPAPHSGTPQTVLAFVSDARGPINNRPQVTNLPRKIVAMREEGNG